MTAQHGAQPNLVSLLACARCSGALTRDTEGLSCEACGAQFPRIGGCELLLPRPFETLRLWSEALSVFVGSSLSAAQSLLAALQASPPGRTRVRIEQARSGLLTRCERVRELLVEAGLDPGALPPSSSSPAGRNRITSYYDHIHRDWGWDEGHSQENRIALELVREMLPSHPPSTALVLGAGACRLAYDLHQSAGIGCTLALDINPLPFVVARKLIAGETVCLPELPATPRSSELERLDRRLRCSSPNAPGFHLVFADGLAPPVVDHAFDLVLTPWFIDQIPRDIAELLPQIHRVLRPGGVWVNHGPLLYDPRHTAVLHRYRVDELLELLDASGFAIEHHRWDRLLYMQSPAGTQGRTEGVLSFRARARPQ